MSFKKFVMLVFGGFFLIFMILMISTFSDEGAYLLILQRNSDVAKKRAAITQEMEDMEKVKLSDINGDTTKKKSSNSVTNGTGVNLLLIDSLTEGYAKEMLTLFKKSANGELSNYQAHVGITALCGIQSCETGWYSGSHLLKSYLPYSNGKVIWNEAYNGASAGDMTLSKFDNTVVSKIGVNSITDGIDSNYSQTVFQHDNWSSSGEKSSMNGAGNSGRTEGDHYYLPDVLAANDKLLKSALDTTGLGSVDSSKLNDSFMASFYALSHGRGSDGVIRFTFGLGYNQLSSDYVDTSALSEAKLIETYSYFSEFGNDFKNTMKASTFYNALGGTNNLRYVVCCVAANTDGWFISSKAYNYCMNNSDTVINIWNCCYPNDQISGSDQLSKKLQSSCMNLKDAIKSVNGVTVTDSDTSSVYNTTNAWDDSISYDWGAVYHVSKDRCEAYKNKYSDGSTPFLVQCYDIVMCGEAFGANVTGSYVYAYMLYEGGLADVDPTNPDTYCGKLDKENTFVPSKSETSWMDAWGIDTSELTEDRLNLINTGYNMTQSGATYAMDAATMNAEFESNITPTKIDCSGFVSKATNNCGFTFFKRQTVHYWFYDNRYSCIDPKDVKPGDVMATLSFADSNADTTATEENYNKQSSSGVSGHVMFWLAGSKDGSGSYVVMDSNDTSNQNGPKVRVINYKYKEFGQAGDKAYDGKYYFFRLNEMDAGNYKTHTQKYK